MIALAEGAFYSGVPPVTSLVELACAEHLAAAWLTVCQSGWATLTAAASRIASQQLPAKSVQEKHRNK